MNITLNFKDSRLAMTRNPQGLKSTQEKQQRQAERDQKVAFFEAQKENLKNVKADTLEEISKKLDMFHNYEDEIAAAKEEYNSSQMFHAMDEAQERGEKIAEQTKKNKPKTEEERKEEQKDEILGTDNDKSKLTDSMEEVSDMIDKAASDDLKTETDDLEKMADDLQAQQTAEKETLSDAPGIVSDVSDIQQTADDNTASVSAIPKTPQNKYVPIDVRV